MYFWGPSKEHHNLYPLLILNYFTEFKSANYGSMGLHHPHTPSNYWPASFSSHIPTYVTTLATYTYMCHHLYHRYLHVCHNSCHRNRVSFIGASRILGRPTNDINGASLWLGNWLCTVSHHCWKDRFLLILLLFQVGFLVCKTSQLLTMQHTG